MQDKVRQEPATGASDFMVWVFLHWERDELWCCPQTLVGIGTSCLSRAFLPGWVTVLSGQEECQGSTALCFGLQEDCWVSGCLLPAQSISQEKNFLLAWKVGKRQSYGFSSEGKGRGDGIYLSVKGWILQDMQGGMGYICLQKGEYYMTRKGGIGYICL